MTNEDTFETLQDIGAGILDTVKTPISLNAIQSLALFFGQTMVLSALDLVENDDGSL